MAAVEGAAAIPGFLERKRVNMLIKEPLETAAILLEMLDWGAGGIVFQYMKYGASVNAEVQYESDSE